MWNFLFPVTPFTNEPAGPWTPAGAGIFTRAGGQVPACRHGEGSGASSAAQSPRGRRDALDPAPRPPRDRWAGGRPGSGGGPEAVRAAARWAPRAGGGPGQTSEALGAVGVLPPPRCPSILPWSGQREPPGLPLLAKVAAPGCSGAPRLPGALPGRSPRPSPRRRSGARGAVSPEGVSRGYARVQPGVLRKYGTKPS